MANKPVTVDLLHPTVVRAFTNWGYISFFGCIAALVTLLFFAIGQVKQADEARQQHGVPTTSAPVTQDTALEMPPEFELVDSPYMYRNDLLGFSVNYAPLVGPWPIFRSAYEPNGESGVGFVQAHRADNGQTIYGPIFQVNWVRDSRTIDLFEADERARINRDIPRYANMVKFSRSIVDGVEGLRAIGEPGECGADIYTFFLKGYRVRLEAVCSNEDEFSSVLESLNFN